jgi:YVTN family beta-propeller protein
MQMAIASALVFLMALTCQVKAQPLKEQDAGLHQGKRIALEGVEGRIDHLAFDAKNRRLYVAALGNNSVEIIDVKAGKRMAQIKGIKKPQGVWVLPESRTLVVASGDDGKCRFYDEHQKLLGTIDGLDDADNVRYDDEAKLVYVGYGEGALAVIDPRKMEKVTDIKLDGHPESFRLEEKGKRIFVNVPSAKHIAVINRQKRTVEAMWPLKDAQANFPMFLDEINHRLIVGCRQPAKVLVIDTESGHVVANLGCCGDTDDVFYDAKAQRVYVSGGEGCVSVIERRDRDVYQAVGRVATSAGARTSLFVPEEQALYLAVPHRGGQAAEIRVLSLTAEGRP